jgi:hypothetical protein
MNPNSGGSHILLFERDQQLTTLLTSEFQLAGYECHPARTAVEVFDAIARNPIRLVLVNLAQPAASRREFWVALDTQRRGRGVQVLTFRCANIGGYGSDDADDSTHTVLTDVEVDGMMGIIQLVDAVRARIPGPITGSFSQIAAAAGANAQNAPAPVTNSISSRATKPTLAATTTTNQIPAGTTRPQATNRPANPASGFTDKIRAVIYPSSRNISPTRETPPNQVTATVDTSRMADRPVQESGLAQLSRMVHESHLTETNDFAEAGILKQPTSPLTAQVVQQAPIQINQADDNTVTTPAQGSNLQQIQTADANAISTLTLRASPIEDIPIERGQEHRSSYVGIQSLHSDKTEEEVASVSTSATISRPEPMVIVEPEKELSPALATTLDVEEQLSTPRVEEIEAIASSVAEIARFSAKEVQSQPSSTESTTDDTLLDIVQSLPPMSPLPKPQLQTSTPVLSGRATRTLGNVLLEGHLVPQHRLEVAQHIQRMLRGVDMNYQLGEILLMFKLLTPDQLLAASLVSYGLISTAQISALGRIRQELHAISLEYDLESLLVLFRILTPEQLREVRASWMG